MTNYETTQRKQNLAVGLFVIMSACSLFWLIFKFGDLPLFVSQWKSFQVTVQFPAAPGVQENTPVRFCGYQIGRVTEVKKPKVMKEVDSGRIYHQTIVVLSIDKDYDDIPANAQVKLMTRGLGSSYIELKVPLKDVMKPPSEFLADKSVLQGSTGMTSEFFPEESQKKLEEMVEGIDALVRSANDIFGDKANKENIKASLANLSETSKQAAASLKQFRKFSTTGTRMTEELSKATTELREILQKINEGQGSLARLVNDGKFYEEMLESSRQLDMLLEEIRLFVAKARDKGVPIKLK